MGGDVEEVLRDVGLAEEDDEGISGVGQGKQKEEAKVFLHCTVGGVEGEVDKRKEEDEVGLDHTLSKGRTVLISQPAAPRRRGFDVLLDAGLSQADVAQMRRQFYESRGEEVPEGLERGDLGESAPLPRIGSFVVGLRVTDSLTGST